MTDLPQDAAFPYLTLGQSLGARLEHGQWLEGAGLKTARITGSGIFKDAASDEIVRGYFFSGIIRDCPSSASPARQPASTVTKSSSV